MIRVAIVEDTQSDRDWLLALIGEWDAVYKKEIAVDIYSDAVSFLQKGAVNSNIIFMDIRMPQMSGMAAAQKLREVNADSVLIFLTTLAGYAIKGYAVNAMDFIVKPISRERFFHTFERAVGLWEKKKQYIVIQTKDQVLKVSTDEVLYIEASAHDKVYHVGTETYCVSEDMNHLLNTLPDEFVRCHRSYIVNLKNIAFIGKDSVKLAGSDAFVPVSRNRRDELIAALTKYYAGTM